MRETLNTRELLLNTSGSLLLFHKRERTNRPRAFVSTIGVVSEHLGGFREPVFMDLPPRCFTVQEVMEKNKKIQQDKKIAYDLKVAEVSAR